MKVQCPDCGWSAEVPDDKIPAGGGKGTCPKCKAKFAVFKQEWVNIVEQSNEIPSFLLKSDELVNKTNLDQQGIKLCPLCGEEILAMATECQHCKSMTGDISAKKNINFWVCECGKKIAVSIKNCPHCKTTRSTVIETVTCNYCGKDRLNTIPECTCTPTPFQLAHAAFLEIGKKKADKHQEYEQKKVGLETEISEQNKYPLILEVNGEYKIRKYLKNNSSIDNSVSLGDRASIGCGMSIVLLAVGGVATLIPIIGIIIGPLIVFSGVIAPLIAATTNVNKIKPKETEFFTAIDGPCPYCTGYNLHITDEFNNVMGVDCPTCKKRIVIRNKQFFSV